MIWKKSFWGEDGKSWNGLFVQSRNADYGLWFIIPFQERRGRKDIKLLLWGFVRENSCLISVWWSCQEWILWWFFADLGKRGLGFGWIRLKILVKLGKFESLKPWQWDGVRHFGWQEWCGWHWVVGWFLAWLLLMNLPARCGPETSARSTLVDFPTLQASIQETQHWQKKRNLWIRMCRVFFFFFLGFFYVVCVSRANVWWFVWIYMMIWSKSGMWCLIKDCLF